MTEVTLESIAKQIEHVLDEYRAMRADLRVQEAYLQKIDNMTRRLEQQILHISEELQTMNERLQKIRDS